MMKILFIFFYLLLGTLISYSQVVNVESKRMRTDTTGWAGEADVTYDIVKNTDYIFNVGLTSQLQYKNKKSIVLLLADYRFVKAAGTKYINTGYLHLRYDYKILPKITWEVFSQGQFNQVLDIGLRALIGTGPRLKIYDTDSFRLYFASLYMYEYEENNEKTIFRRNQRSSSYLTFTIDFPRFEIIHTTYYQPKYTDLKDYRIASQTKLKFKIFKHLDFITTFSYRFESEPFPDIPRDTYSISNGLTLKF
jgi:hypothetical protein